MKITASEARKQLDNSRRKVSEERKNSEKERKGILAKEKMVTQTVGRILAKALAEAMRGGIYVQIDEVEDEHVEEALKSLGYKFNEIDIPLFDEDSNPVDLTGISVSQLRKMSKSLESALTQIRKTAIQHNAWDYCSLADEFQPSDDLEQNTKFLIETLVKIRDLYEDDTDINLDFDAKLGAELLDVASILDEHYFEVDDISETCSAPVLSWEEDCDLPFQDSNLPTANCLKFLAQNSENLFDSIGRAVKEAIRDNNSYFHLYITQGETRSTIKFPQDIEEIVPLSMANLITVLEAQEFKCTLSNVRESFTSKLKVTF